MSGLRAQAPISRSCSGFRAAGSIESRAFLAVNLTCKARFLAEVANARSLRASAECAYWEGNAPTIELLVDACGARDREKGLAGRCRDNPFWGLLGDPNPLRCLH